MRKCILLLLILTVPLVAAEQIVINSEDWRDVYAGMHLGAVTDREASFVTDQAQAQRLIQGLGSDTDVLVITGDELVNGLPTLLQAAGYTVTDNIRSRDAIETLNDFALDTDTENLIVVDDAYGYDALAVATYARVTDSSVVFASDATASIVEQKQPGEILLYGTIPSEVFEELEQYDPIIINEQDRFESNFALVQRFQQVVPAQAILLSNGEFLEAQLVQDDKPLLFTGRQRVPEEVIDFLNEQNFRMGIMVGNSLAPNALEIKDETGMSVFIKFAQGQNQQQFALDLFDLPIPNPLVRISTTEYDPTTQRLLVTYENPGEVPVYFSATFSSEGQSVSDSEPVFLEAGTYKTIAYPIEAGDEAAYTLLFGAYPQTLEQIVQGTVNPTRVEVSDASDIDILEAYYVLDDEQFVIIAENLGPAEVYTLIELVDVRIGGERIRLASEIVRFDEQEEIIIPASLTESDIARNQVLEIEAFFGEREFSLVNQKSATLPFETRDSSGNLWLYVAGIAIILIIIFLMTRRPRRRGR